jgi:hypothetical protein
MSDNAQGGVALMVILAFAFLMIAIWTSHHLQAGATAAAFLVIAGGIAHVGRR